MLRLHKPDRFPENEFDPDTEAQHHLITVFAVNPGCTQEIQIVARDGRVSRLTTTDEPAADQKAIEALIIQEVRRCCDMVPG